ncbi:MAG: electron transfer flavoprotein alpha/ beta subunit [Deltaproteobacteria bacterium]|nr:electron transfer flavoprotein alpha/ beta subunit [Deltaproteobacteria bacterium]
MRIAVCIKQVPVVSALTLDPATKALKREGVACEVSSFDLRALTKAVDLRAKHGGEVVAITMGPPQASEALLECLALGADRALHLCDRQFAGSDTLATARALALALQIEPYDLILCGRYSVDAETGQVGPEVAELLGIAQITAAQELVVDMEKRQVRARRETDDGTESVVAPLPVLVTATEDLAPERFPSKADREAAKSKACVQISASDLSKNVAQFGSMGSPTWVEGLHHVETARLGKIIAAPTAQAAAAELARTLVDDHHLFGSLKVQEQPAIATIATQHSHTAGKDIWVMAEVLGDNVRPVTFELLGKAREIADALRSQVAAIVLGNSAARFAPALAAHGADRVLVGEHPMLAWFDVDNQTRISTRAITALQPRMVLFGATASGRDLAPRLAARLQLGLTGDCIDLGVDSSGHLVQYKPAFGGAVVAPILSKTIPAMASVRPGMLRALDPDPSRPVRIEELSVEEVQAPRVLVTERRPIGDAAAALDNSEIVIGLGKGFGSRENLDAAHELASLLGASFCTTRDVADEGWLPRQLQVGLTGRAIAPKLYIAVAIRGAFEHMVGLRRAGLIVAINKNPKAPVFKSADYGIVGDYRDVLPALCRELAAARA